MDLIGKEITKRNLELKMTILYRPNGIWHPSETTKLVNNFMTALSEHPQHPEYLVIYGHYTKEETLNAIGGGVAYTATQITGLQNEELPFKPRFI